MANTRQLATTDEEALLPKRVKKKKNTQTITTKSIQIIMQEMQQMNIRLNAIKKKLGENKELPAILSTHFTSAGLPFLDIPSLFAYSTTSKQAYINAHEHRITRFSFLSASARQHLNRAQALSNQIDKKADLAIDITDENSSSTKAFIVTAFIGCIVAFIPPAIAFSLCMKFLGRTSDENKMGVPILFGSLVGAAILSGVILLIIRLKVYPALKNHFNDIKETNKEELNLLTQFSDLLEKNDLDALEKKLHEHLQYDDSSKIKRELRLFPPAEERTNAVSDDEEEAPLLRLKN